MTTSRRPRQAEHDFNSFHTAQARISAQSNADLNNSINELPTNRSPFNPAIYTDVDDRVDANLRSMERRPVLTKYSLGTHKSGNIALYDPRHNINYSDVAEYSNNRLTNNLYERARSKVVQRNNYRLPSFQSNPNNAEVLTPADLGFGGPTLTQTLQSVSEVQRVHPQTQQMFSANGSAISSTLPPLVRLNQPRTLQDIANYGFESNTNRLQEQFTTPDLNSNGDAFNPYQPYSDTNIPPVGYPTTLVDERIDQARNSIQRPWNWYSDRERTARQLQNSPEIKARNERQHEADDALFRRTHKLGRYSENNYAYHRRPHDQRIVVDPETLKQTSVRSMRHNIEGLEPKNITLERFNNAPEKVLSDDAFNVLTPHALAVDLSNHESLIDNTLRNQYNESLKRESFNEESNEVGFIESIPRAIDKAITAIRDMFKPHAKDRYSDDIVDRDKLTSTMSDGIVQRTDTSSRQRAITQHMVVTRDGVHEDMFAKPGDQDTAYMYVGKDDYGITRTIAFLDGKNLKLVQRKPRNTVFRGDGKPFGDDVVFVELPVEQLSDDFRHRLHVWNPNTSRKEPLRLQYDDFVELVGIAEAHPQMQKRGSREHTRSYVRELDTTFENVRKLFVDDNAQTVYRQESKAERGNFERYARGRADKVQEDFAVDVITTNGPLQPRSSSDSLRWQRYHYGSGGSIRGKGVQLGKL